MAVVKLHRQLFQTREFYQLNGEMTSCDIPRLVFNQLNFTHFPL